MRGKNIWDFNKHGKILTGTYAGLLPNMGRFGNTLYLIKDRSGKTWAIWGSYQVKIVLQLLQPGKKVRIRFIGKKKKGKGWVNDFKINVGKGTEKDLSHRKHPVIERSKKPRSQKRVTVRRRQ